MAEEELIMKIEKVVHNGETFTYVEQNHVSRSNWIVGLLLVGIIVFTVIGVLQ